MDRRTVLRGGLAGVGAAAVGGLSACVPSPPAPGPTPVDPGPFDCGIASGVHSDTAAVLWTRFAPAATAAVSLAWQVAVDPDFAQVVGDGTVVASPDTDGCAKALAEGLQPGGTYFFRFATGALQSPIGRTKTLPAPGTTPAAVRLAVASCQKYSSGFYPAWRAIAEEDLDAVIHLGDYIYESSNTSSTLRIDPVLAVDLPTYRAKYRLYRSDPDLRAAHAAHPFAPVWDDHEFVNDCNRLTLLEQPERAAAAYRAWWEYQPVWRIDGDRIHRRARWGDLVDLSMLDTRQYRDPGIAVGSEVPDLGSTASGPLAGVHATDRTMLGAQQRQWFLDGMAAAQQDAIRWKLVANQVMISPIRMIDLDEPILRLLEPDLPRNAGVYFNFDDWDGYQAERSVITEALADERISNVAFLTGDTHMFWQSSVLRDHDERRSPTVAQEFVCGSISSTGLDGRTELGELLNPGLAEGLRSFHPPFRYADLIRRGYGLVECTAEATSVEYRIVDALARRPAAVPTRTRARFDWPVDTHDIQLTWP